MVPNAANLSHDKPVPNDLRQGQPLAGQLAKPILGNNMSRPPQPQPHTPRQGQPPRPQNALQAKDPVNQAMAPPQQPPPGEPVAFFSARSTLDLNESAGNQNQQKQLFNPKAESPSIRKTPGIDHSASKPLARNGQHVPPSQTSSSQSANTGGFTPVRPSVGSSQVKGNTVNPSLDQARRIGAPGGLGSPLANRGQYKPPTMKRTLPSEGNGANGPRAPLVDIPTNANNANSGDGLDAKRQKVA
jgi:DNA repair and recombination protein RAD52